MESLPETTTGPGVETTPQTTPNQIIGLNETHVKSPKCDKFTTVGYLTKNLKSCSLQTAKLLMK